MGEYRQIAGEIRLLQQENDFLFPVEIWAYNNSDNLNGWRFEELEKHRAAWSGVPVLVAYVNGGSKTGDGHNQRTRIDKNGEEYQSFTDADAERIVGATSDEESDIRVESDGEHKWLVAKATLYRWYARELTDKIIADAQQGRAMAVSIEALVTESHMDGDIEVEDAYLPLGITILGDGVAPAVPGAHVKMLSELQEEFKQLKLRAASYQAKNAARKPNNNDDKGVNKRMNKTIAKELASKFPDHYVIGASENGLNVALMSKDGNETFGYAFAPEDKGAVLPERLTPVTLAADMQIGEEHVSVDFQSMIEHVCANISTLSSENAELRKKCERLEQEAETAKTRETARRIKASCDAAAAQLAEINANRAEAERFDDTIIDDIKKSAGDGDFVDCETESGEWCGEAEARKAVRDVCMSKQMEMDKAHAEAVRKASHRSYAFEPGFTGETGTDSLEGLYKSMVNN